MSLWTQPTPTTYKTRFHPGQKRAWQSDKRFVVVLAGTQSGKTSWGPLWLKREIDRRGPGDYLAATASYDLFKLKMLPALRECFEQVYGHGRYWSGDRLIELADPTGHFWAQRVDDPMWGRIILRSAESDAGLESSTALAAWLDEAGHSNFSLSSWEAILRRLSLSEGRALLTTTIYDMGWLKHALYDRFPADPAIDIIQFDSIANPAFPRAEWERARATLPHWKFNMFYRGRYERPAGLIYDSFDETADVIDAFPIPANWPRFLGLDFGGVNTAGVFYAEEPGSQPRTFHAYREYLAGGRTAREHAGALLAGERRPICFGGARSEGQWRQEFLFGGLPVQVPLLSDVEIGIQRVYGAHTQHRIKVHRQSCPGYLNQKRSYRRKLDVRGEPLLEIEDKHAYHFLDAERYVLSYLMAPLSDGGFLQ